MEEPESHPIKERNGKASFASAAAFSRAQIIFSPNEGGEWGGSLYMFQQVKLKIPLPAIRDVTKNATLETRSQ